MADMTTKADVVTGGPRALFLYQPFVNDPLPQTTTYAITGGADASKFRLEKDVTPADVGVSLFFNTPPDINRPADSGGDNTYDVEVTGTRTWLGTTTTTAYSLRVVPDDHPQGVNTTSTISSDGVPVFGSINSRADEDWLRFESKGGSYLVSETFGGSFRFTDAARSFSLGTLGGEFRPEIIDLPAGQLFVTVGLVDTDPQAYSVAIEEAGSTLRAAFRDAVKIGTDKADIIYGNTSEPDTLSGLGGGDYIQGDKLADVIDGGAGRDYLRGFDGADSILGGADNDDINGNQGADTARGGDGNDWVVGGQDADLLDGETGNDIVYGNLGNDIAYGGVGDDWVRGGQGDDVIYGGAGADFMSGDRGSDTVYGGEGVDRFNLVAEAGVDRVMDFNSGEGDRVSIEGGLSYTLSFSGGDAHITLSDGSDMVLVGVSNAGQLGNWLLAS